MKISTHPSRQAGNVFLIVMMTTGILSAICLGSYLSLASQENRTVMRSLAWNTAMPLAEAGAEEALSQITKNTSNFAADGWTLQGTNTYTKQRTLSTGHYTVSLSGSAGSQVTITSTGYALFQGTNSLSRTVQVISQSGSSQPTMIGLVAKNGITFKGDFSVDSYNSTNSAYSTNGQYDSAKHSDRATVATPLGFTLGGNESIYGYIATATGGSVSAGGNAKVGETSWVDGKNKGVEPGHYTNSFNAAIPDVQLPYTSAAAPTSGTVSNTSYNYVLSGGNYMITNLDAGGGNTSVVVTSPSMLVVSGNVSLANIVFAPGATLDLYVASPSIGFYPTLTPLTGTQAVTPIQFRVWGLPSCTDMHMNAGNSFTGIIYAPELNFQANGHASFYGSITAGTFNCNGTFDFHYDEATARYVAGGAAFSIISWREL